MSETLYHDHQFVSSINFSGDMTENLVICKRCGYAARIGPPIEIAQCPAWKSNLWTKKHGVTENGLFQEPKKEN